MRDYRSLVYAAKVLQLGWKDKDFELTMRSLRRNRFSTYFRTIRVVFSDVTHVDSKDLANDMLLWELDEISPGFEVESLNYENGVATLGVAMPDIHEVWSRRYFLICADLEVTHRIDLLRSLFNRFVRF